MIKAYGLHWHSDKVFWGRPRVPGTLLGAVSRTKSAKPIDFRDQRGIYALYANYDLVYVGQAGKNTGDRLFKRLRAHKRDHLSERWNRFSWFGTQWVTQHGLSADIEKLHGNVSLVLDILEAVATAIAEPRLNLQRGRWSKVPQYYQYVSKEEQEEEE
ncbi:GIY-YIG nuclease family protein [Rhodopila sp.]|uniref:GIY-YIG nuclease family protein n=1 Tax=Rhodopila sp. TaxID=2480087 RepID=UPI003D0978C0